MWAPIIYECLFKTLSIVVQRPYLSHNKERSGVYLDRSVTDCRLFVSLNRVMNLIYRFLVSAFTLHNFSVCCDNYKLDKCVLPCIIVQSHCSVWHQLMIIHSNMHIYVRGTLGISRERSSYAGICRCTLLYAEAKFFFGHV